MLTRLYRCLPKSSLTPTFQMLPKIYRNTFSTQASQQPSLNYSIIYETWQKKLEYIKVISKQPKCDKYKLLQMLILNLQSFHCKSDFINTNLSLIIKAYNTKIIEDIQRSTVGQKQLEVFLIHYLSTVKYWILRRIYNQEAVVLAERALEEFVYCSVMAPALERLVRRIFMAKGRESDGGEEEGESGERLQEVKGAELTSQKGLQLTELLQTYCLLPYIPKQQLNSYQQLMVPKVKYITEIDLIIVLHQIVQNKIKLTKEFANDIQNLQIYKQISTIIFSLIKSRFIIFMLGDYSPLYEMQFYHTFRKFFSKGTMVSHEEFCALLMILTAESKYSTMETSRFYIENNCNQLIKIANGQKYESDVSFDMMSSLYILLSNMICSGESLLEQITKLISNLVVKQSDLKVLKLVLKNVLENKQRRLSYQKIDPLNKEYTAKTVQFLIMFLNKVAVIWPQVILEISDFSFSDRQITWILEQSFQTIIEKHGNDLSLQQNPIFTKKVIDFLFHNKNTIKIQQKYLTNFTQELFQQRNKDTHNFLYKLTILLSNSQSTQAVKQLHQINTYIEQKISDVINNQQPLLINTNGKQNLYLVLIGWALMKFNVKQETKSQKIHLNQQLLVKFVNIKLQYILKSVVYEQLLQILNFLHSVNYPVQLELFQMAYRNLYCFIIYVTDSAKQYLNSDYRQQYQNILFQAISNKQTLVKLSDKKSLTMLQVFYCRLSRSSHKSLQQTLDFIQILGNPQNLTIEMKHMIETTQFPPSLLSHRNIQRISSFSLINKSILNFLEEQDLSHFSSESLIKIMHMPTNQLEKYFKNNKIYQTIMCDSSIIFRHKIPAPQTNETDIQMIYICHEIFQKIHNRNNYSFDQIYKKTRNGQKLSFESVDLAAEKKYIMEKGLVQFTDFNQFQLDNISLPKHRKVQIWKKNSFTQSKYQILSLYSMDTITVDVYIKIIKAVYGSFQKVKEIAGRFHHHSVVLIIATMMKLQFQPNGAFVTIWRDNDSSNSLTFVCVNDNNYKFMLICAHIMQTIGKKNVCIIDENVQREELKAFIQLKFPQEQNSLELDETI